MEKDGSHGKSLSFLGKKFRRKSTKSEAKQLQEFLGEATEDADYASSFPYNEYCDALAAQSLGDDTGDNAMRSEMAEVAPETAATGHVEEECIPVTVIGSGQGQSEMERELPGEHKNELTTTMGFNFNFVPTRSYNFESPDDFQESYDTFDPESIDSPGRGDNVNDFYDRYDYRSSEDDLVFVSQEMAMQPETESPYRYKKIRSLSPVFEETLLERYLEEQALTAFAIKTDEVKEYESEDKPEKQNNLFSLPDVKTTTTGTADKTETTSSITTERPDEKLKLNSSAEINCKSSSNVMDQEITTKDKSTSNHSECFSIDKNYNESNETGDIFNKNSKDVESFSNALGLARPFEKISIEHERTEDQVTEKHKSSIQESNQSTSNFNHNTQDIYSNIPNNFKTHELVITPNKEKLKLQIAEAGEKIDSSSAGGNSGVNYESLDTESNVNLVVNDSRVNSDVEEDWESPRRRKIAMSFNNGQRNASKYDRNSNEFRDVSDPRNITRTVSEVHRRSNQDINGSPTASSSSRSSSILSRSSSFPASVDSGVKMGFIGEVVHHSSIVVVAIDFGTTFSGYAFAFSRDPDSIHMMRKWEGGDPGVTNQKTPTTLLLKPDGSFHSFGFGARDFYHDLDPSDAKKWLYFEKFKMTLHSSQDLTPAVLIKAANGKPYPAFKVFAHALRFFKHHVLTELSDQSTAKILEEDITWVLTVPAIWRQPAKQFMRMAAYEAGIASLDAPERLLIALEPEAASIFCRKLRLRDCVLEDDIKQKAGDDSLVSEEFEGLTQYVIVDCGGGTVDLAVHELDVDAGTLKELHRGTGGPAGAAGVDGEFEKLLKQIFDSEFIERFKLKRPAGWVDLMIAFESKKRTTRPGSQTALNISLPFSFIDYYKKRKRSTVENAIKKYKNADIKWSSQGMLRIAPSIIKTLFQPVIREILLHIQSLLYQPSLNEVKYLFLVGGFAESPLLQNAVQEAFSKRVKIVIPHDVGLTILKGAVQFGLNPTVVRVRRSALTYGVGVLNKYNPDKHNPGKRVIKDGVIWCKDIFDTFVAVDESVGVGDRVTRSYAPARLGQKSTVINIFCSERTDNMYTTDAGVQKCGQLRIDMPPLNTEEVPPEKRNRPRELQASMVFGDTEIKVNAVDVLTGRQTRALIDFLNY